MKYFLANNDKTITLLGTGAIFVCAMHGGLIGSIAAAALAYGIARFVHWANK